MNQVKLFLNTPLLIFILARLLVKPVSVTSEKDYLEWSEMYKTVYSDIKGISGNKLDNFIRDILLRKLNAEMDAIYRCRMNGMIVLKTEATK
jgi:hypothetical protein